MSSPELLVAVDAVGVVLLAKAAVDDAVVVVVVAAAGVEPSPLKDVPTLQDNFHPVKF